MVIISANIVTLINGPISRQQIVESKVLVRIGLIIVNEISFLGASGFLYLIVQDIFTDGEIIIPVGIDKASVID